MTKKLTLSSRALVTLAENFLKSSKEITNDEAQAFFDEYNENSDKGIMPDAIIVDMRDRTEWRFDGAYFLNHCAISAYLSHESCTHIFLQTEKKIFVYHVLENNPNYSYHASILE